MPVQYKIIEDLKVVYVQLKNLVSLDDHLQYIRTLSKDEHYIPPMKKIVDYRYCQRYEVYPIDEERIAQKKDQYSDKFVNELCAIVAPSDLLYGSNRVFQVHTYRSGIETMVFRSMSEAIDWLKVDIDENELLI